MKPSTHRLSRRAVRAQQGPLAAPHVQWQDAPALFSDRDDDAAEYASLLRDFECARDEELGSGRYS